MDAASYLLTIDQLVPLVDEVHNCRVDKFLYHFADSWGLEDVFFDVGLQSKFVTEVASHHLENDVFEFFCLGHNLLSPFENNALDASEAICLAGKALQSRHQFEDRLAELALEVCEVRKFFFSFI